LIGNIVARRYAKALYALGVKDKAADTLGKDLAGLAGALDTSPELGKLFSNPSFNAQEKKGVVKEVAGRLGMSPLTTNFLSLLADKGRLDAVAEINAVFAELLDEAHGVVRGHMITAVKLPEKRQKDIKSSLEKRLGKKLVLDYGVDKNILGGVILKVGDKVLDGSLRAQLQTLKDQIKRGE